MLQSYGFNLITVYNCFFKIRGSFTMILNIMKTYGFKLKVKLEPINIGYGKVYKEL